MVYPLVHHSCKQKLFAVLKTHRFYCRKCRVFITARDEKGNLVKQNPQTPSITEEEIYAAMRNGTTFSDRKAIFKLATRPKDTL